MEDNQGKDQRQDAREVPCGNRDGDKVCAVTGDPCLETDRNCPFWTDPADAG